MSMYVPHGELTPHVQYLIPFVSFAEQRARAAGGGKAQGSDSVDLQALSAHVGWDSMPDDVCGGCSGVFSWDSMPDVNASVGTVHDCSAPSGDKPGNGSSVVDALGTSVAFGCKSEAGAKVGQIAGLVKALADDPVVQAVID